MTTGIYRLVFSDGVAYIGQSVNIETRLTEHNDNMKSGKATIKMREAFSIYGLPKAFIVAECHKNHLDILENYYISKENPSINVSRPPVDPDSSIIETNLGLLKSSTLTLVKHIHTLRLGMEACNSEISDLEKEIQGLKTIRTQEELTNTAMLELSSYKLMLDIKSREVKELQKKLNIPWWKQIFK